MLRKNQNNSDEKARFTRNTLYMHAKEKTFINYNKKTNKIQYKYSTKYFFKYCLIKFISGLGLFESNKIDANNV